MIKKAFPVKFSMKKPKSRTIFPELFVQYRLFVTGEYNFSVYATLHLGLKNGNQATWR